MTAPTHKRSLGLDNDEDAPYRLIQFPCGSLLAYGGDDGQISCMQERAHDGDDEKNIDDFVVVHRYDDGVRAVAISADTKRVAVGFDNGSTRIYTFDDESTHAHPHPFAKVQKQSDEDMLMSQDISSQLDFFLGPHFDAPIRDMKFVDDHWLAVATESGMCLVHADTSETLLERKLEQEVKEHHDHCGIRGVSVSDNNLIATLGMDGRLCVWDYETLKLVVRESLTCISRKDVGEIHGADPYDRSCRPLFFKNLLATPGQLLPNLRMVSDDKVELIKIDDSKIGDKGHIESIVCLAVTKDCILTGGRDARVILWEYKAKGSLLPLQTFSLEAPVTDMLICNGRVHAATATGNYVVLKLDRVQTTQKEVKERVSTSESLMETEAEASELQATTKMKKKINPSLSDFDDDDDDDDSRMEDPKHMEVNDEKSTEELQTENDESEPKSTLSKKLKKKKNSPTNKFDDDDDDVDFETEKSMTVNRVRFVDDEAEDDDNNNNNIGASANADIRAVDTDGMDGTDNTDALPDNSKTDMEPDVDDDDPEDDLEDLPAYDAVQTISIPSQPAFSPSSTPLDLTRRFLCWNHIGSVTLLQGSNNRNTVDIHFTDSAYRRPISFTDNMNFILGALGEDGGIFASDLQEDDDEDNEDIDGLDDLAMSERTKQAVKKSHRKRQPDARPTGSIIFFYKFETFGKQREKDWFLNLPDGERVLGAATGEGWAAVMTSRRFLRLFTSGGNQSQIVWLKGNPVTLVGRSRFLSAVYHEGTPLPDGTQKLGYTLWDATCFKVISEGSLSCISKGSSLTWLGFSNDCSLMAMDSDGMLSMLVSCGSGSKAEANTWAWSPVLDTVGLRKSSDDQFWPITVYDGKLVSVPLKGGNSYPDATRRPVTTTLPLRLPLAKSSIPKNTGLEELSIRSNMALAQKKIMKELEHGSSEIDSPDDLEREYMQMCAQVDKVTLKLFAATIDAQKLDRAFDLVHRLHLEKSYDLAIRLADQHRKLADLIEDAKLQRFAVDDIENEEEDDESSALSSLPRTTLFKSNRLPTSRQISPDGGHNLKIKGALELSGNSLNKKRRLA